MAQARTSSTGSVARWLGVGAQQCASVLLGLPWSESGTTEGSIVGSSEWAVDSHACFRCDLALFRSCAAAVTVFFCMSGFLLPLFGRKRCRRRHGAVFASEHLNTGRGSLRYVSSRRPSSHRPHVSMMLGRVFRSRCFVSACL